jgi:hypothetical protein
MMMATASALKANREVVMVGRWLRRDMGCSCVRWVEMYWGVSSKSRKPTLPKGCAWVLEREAKVEEFA